MLEDNLLKLKRKTPGSGKQDGGEKEKKPWYLGLSYQHGRQATWSGARREKESGGCGKVSAEHALALDSIGEEQTEKKEKVASFQIKTDGWTDTA